MGWEGSWGSSRGCANEGTTWIYVWNVAKELMIALILLEVAKCLRSIGLAKIFLLVSNTSSILWLAAHQGIDPIGGRAALPLTHKSMELFGLGRALKLKPSTRAGCGDFLRVPRPCRALTAPTLLSNIARMENSLGRCGPGHALGGSRGGCDL